LDEQVFHTTLKRIRWSTDPADLASATRATLQLLLRRPVDAILLETLLSQLAAITASLPAGTQQSSSIRQAAVRCVALLQSAKHGRLTRAETEELSRRRHRRVMLVMASLAATAMIYLIF
jgi:methionine synthase I (cobalamin-dependent)